MSHSQTRITHLVHSLIVGVWVASMFLCGAHAPTLHKTISYHSQGDHCVVLAQALRPQITVHHFAPIGGTPVLGPSTPIIAALGVALITVAFSSRPDPQRRLYRPFQPNAPPLL